MRLIASLKSSVSAIEIIKQVFTKQINAEIENFGLLRLNALNPDAPKLHVLLTSDKSLCGNYNALIFRHFGKIIKNTSDYKVVPIGSKGVSYANSNHNNFIIRSAKFMDLFNDHSQINILLEEIFSMYESGQISELIVHYVHSVSIASRHAHSESLFDLSSLLGDNCTNKDMQIITKELENVEGEAGHSEHNKEVDSILYEPDKSQVLLNLKRIYFRARFFNFFRNAYFSEMASRMIAMDSANRNSGEIQKKLTLEYNKKRQAAITNDLIDIINGSENI